MDWHAFLWGAGAYFALEVAVGFVKGFRVRVARDRELRARTLAAVAKAEQAAADLRKLADDTKARVGEWKA